MPFRTLLLIAVMATTACSTAQPPMASSRCHASSSSDWAAWVNAMPGPGARPRLIVTGKVVTPTGGNQVTFDTDLQVAESSPAQVTATLAIKAQGEIATQALTTHDVRGEWPATQPIGSVTIRCGGDTLAVISPVETAH